MNDPDFKAIAADGFADAVRRSPVVYAVIIEALAILVLAAWLITSANQERQKAAVYTQSLHAQLVECHRTAPHGTH